MCIEHSSALHSPPSTQPPPTPKKRLLLSPLPPSSTQKNKHKFRSTSLKNLGTVFKKKKMDDSPSDFPDLTASTNSSSLSAENFIDSRPDYCSAWTNEKHNLYIENLESSFVEQLHRSMGLHAWCTEHKTEVQYLSRESTANKRNTSEQLKVGQDGCLQKIDRCQPVLNTEADSLVLNSHFRCAGKHEIETLIHFRDDTAPAMSTRLREKRILSNDLPTSSDEIPSNHEVSVDDTRVHPNYAAEYSDQNFADEVGKEMPSTSMSKRSKTLARIRYFKPQSGSAEKEDGSLLS